MYIIWYCKTNSYFDTTFQKTINDKMNKMCHGLPLHTCTVTILQICLATNLDNSTFKCSKFYARGQIKGRHSSPPSRRFQLCQPGTSSPSQSLSQTHAQMKSKPWAPMCEHCNTSYSESFYQRAEPTLAHPWQKMSLGMMNDSL